MTEQTQIDFSDPEAVATALTETELPEAAEIEPELDDENEVEAKTDKDADGDESATDNEASEEEVEVEDEIEDDEAEEEDADLFEEEIQDSFVSDDSVIDFDGEEMSIAELKKGYSRQSDYTKGKQELSTQKEQLKNFEQEAIAYMSQNVSKYQQMLTDAQTIDMVKLAEVDPRKYAKVSASIKQIEAKIAEESKVVQDWHDNYQSEQAAKTEKEIEAAMPIIEEFIPNFDESKAVEVLAYAAKIGMDEGKARAITDPHFIIALEKAMRYDKAKSAAALKRQPKKQGKTIKAKSTADVAHVESKKTRALREQMANTNNPEVLADLMTQIQFGNKK